MQKKKLKSLRKNTSKIWKMLEDRKKKKEHSGERNCWSDLQQESYLVGQIKDMMRNTGQGWKEIGGDGKKKE